MHIDSTLVACRAANGMPRRTRNRNADQSQLHRGLGHRCVFVTLKLLKLLFAGKWRLRSFRQACGYLTSQRASPPSGWYQIILLGDRGTCVWTTCPESLPDSVSCCYVPRNHMITEVKYSQHTCWLTHLAPGTRCLIPVIVHSCDSVELPCSVYQQAAMIFMPGKTRLQNDLLCVELYLLTHFPIRSYYAENVSTPNEFSAPTSMKSRVGKLEDLFCNEFIL